MLCTRASLPAPHATLRENWCFVITSFRCKVPAPHATLRRCRSAPPHRAAAVGAHSHRRWWQPLPPQLVAARHVNTPAAAGASTRGADGAAAEIGSCTGCQRCAVPVVHHQMPQVLVFFYQIPSL